MPDHPEDAADVPGRQGLRHDVGNRPHVGLLLLERHVDAVVADLDVERVGPVVETRRLARQRVEVPAVPGTAHVAVLDRALAERSALVRASVVQCPVGALEVRHAQGLATAADGLDAPLGQLVGCEDPGPRGLRLALRHRSTPGC